MNKITKILICLTVAILQLTLMPIFKIEGIFPNIVFVGAITLALTDFEENAFLLACFGGLVLDMGSSLPFGINTVLLIALTLSARFLVIKFLPEINIIMVAISIFIFSIIFALIFNLILGRLMGVLILIDGFYSAALGLIFFWQLQRFQKRTQSIKMEKSEYI